MLTQLVEALPAYGTDEPPSATQPQQLLDRLSAKAAEAPTAAVDFGRREEQGRELSAFVLAVELLLEHVDTLSHRVPLLLNLALYTTCKMAFTIIAVTTPIACGVFSPLFLFGAAFGRLYGELLDWATPEDRHITAGASAVVGAAAMAAGVTRTVSCAVMVFELTGQLNNMLPVLVAVSQTRIEGRRQAAPCALSD